MDLNLKYFLISKNISADHKEPKVKHKLHYGRCTGPLFRTIYKYALIYVPTDKDANYTAYIQKRILSLLFALD